MNKKYTIFGVAVVIIVLIGYVVLQNSQNKNSNSIKLGVLIPGSGGSGVDQGEWVKRGLEIAADEVNRSRSQKIELVFEDTQGDPKKAVLAYQSLMARYKMPVVFTWGSSIGMVLKPLVNIDKVIQMGVATAVPEYRSKGDFNFRDFPSSDQEAEYLVKTLLGELNVKEISILKQNNDYGLGSAKAFRDQYEKNGGKIISEESFESGTTDLRTQLTKINNEKPNFVFIATYPKEGGLLLRQAREIGMDSEFIASFAILGGKEFFDIAGKSSDGLILATAIAPFSDKYLHFAQEYKSRYNEELGPQHYVARAYDSLKIIDIVLQKCDPYDTDCLKDELFRIKNYDGLSGNTSFDENGDVLVNFSLHIIRDGKFQVYKK